MANNYKAPIVHGGGYTGEIPTKCQMCARKVKTDTGWHCDKHPQGKFVATIGFTCFEWPKKK